LEISASYNTPYEGNEVIVCFSLQFCKDKSVKFFIYLVSFDRRSWRAELRWDDA